MRFFYPNQKSNALSSDQLNGGTRGNLQNIVKLTTFLTHYSYIEAYRKFRGEYFPEPCPPSTLVFVESLALPEFMIEVEAVAVLD